MENFKSDDEEREPKNKSELTKEELIDLENEKQYTVNRLSGNKFQTVMDKVAFILKESYEARNSDVDLVWDYWTTFENEYFNGGNFTKEDLRKLTSYTSLVRQRRRIQNDYMLFQANDQVRRLRGQLLEDLRQESTDDKPREIGTYTVYIDETGKTQDYLSVGSLWILENESKILKAHKELEEWKIANNITFEFHFNKLEKGRLPIYKEFFTQFLKLYPSVGFKIIIIKNKGLKDKNSAITDLTYHLLSKGIQHEHDSKRARLPRVLQVWIDEEESGSDHLKLANIEERIRRQNIRGLIPDSFQVVSSADNSFIQIIDLYTGAINRKLHSPDGKKIKDEFADFILHSLKFNMDDINDIDKENTNTYISKIFNLR